MKLTTLNISYPIQKFTAVISHFTPRNSTAIEWAILESARLIEEKPKYKKVPIARFFSNILQISDVPSDVNKLLIPCILNLVDIDALESSDDIYDTADLAEVPMLELRLTEDGREMQMRGLLPGSEVENEEDFFYNLYNKELTYGLKFLASRAIDVTLLDDDVDPDDVEIPELEIRSFLDDPKNTFLFSWKNVNTEIKDIRDNSSDEKSNLGWRIQPRGINITGDGKITIDQNRDSLVADKVVDYLAQMSGNSGIDEDAVRNLRIRDVDSEYEKVVLLKDFKAILDKEITVPVSIINTRLAEVNLSQNAAARNRIVIFCGEHDFSCKYDTSSKALIINVPDAAVKKMLGSTAYANMKTLYVVNSVELYADNSRELIPVALQPKKADFDFIGVCQKIIDVYGGQDIKVLFLLFGIGKGNEIPAHVDSLMNSLDFQGRADFLSDMLEKSTQCGYDNMITDDMVGRLLYGDWDLSELSYDEAQKQIESLLNNEFICNRITLLQSGVYKVLDSISESNIDSYIHLLAFMESNDIVKKLLGSERIIRALASDALVELLVSTFDKLPNKMRPVVGIEQPLLDLATHLKNLQAELSRIGYDKGMNESQKKWKILENKNSLNTLDSCVKGFRTAYSSMSAALARRAKSMDTPIRDAEYFNNADYGSFLEASTLVDDVAAVISPYLGALQGNFDEIYVVDTCAIMENPELLDAFKTNKAALVIPKKVLDELDKNKQKTDGDAAQKAQNAAKKIAEFRNFHRNGQKCVFIEDGDVGLLPQEYREGHISGDDIILSVALKFKVRNPIVLTNDVNFSNKVYGESIQQMSSKEFMSQKDQKKERRNES